MTLTERESRCGTGVATWLATVGGAGYFPVAPGTIGAAAGVLLVWLIERTSLARAWLPAVIGAATVAIFAIGVWSAGRAEEFFGRTDPGHVVIDEVAGQMIALVALPQASWKSLVAAFLVFRFFDVVKPFPARRAEHLRGGWGIMVDDVVAGAYSLAVLMLAGRWLR